MDTVYNNLHVLSEAIDSDTNLMDNTDANCELAQITELVDWIAPVIGLAADRQNAIWN